MPTPVESAAPAPADWGRLYALLRDVRAEAQNLLGLVGEIQEKGKLTDPAVREQELHAALQACGEIYQRNRKQMEYLLTQVRGLFQRSSEAYGLFGDEVTHLENYLERARHCWPESRQPVDQVLHLLAEIEGWLNKIVWHCALVTIPPRVGDHLDQLRVGHALDFGREFQDELPSADERTALLQFMHDHPQPIPGVVDVARGLIYKAAASPRKRWASVLRLCVAVLAGAGLAALVAWAGPRLPDSPVPAGLVKPLLLGYGFIMLGGLVHVGIDALKQRRAATAPTFFALNDWLLWVHVRETSILMGILSLWLGLAMLAVIRRGDISWAEMFLAGYGIDSLMELFLQRFDKMASAGTETLKQGLSPATVGKVNA